MSRVKDYYEVNYWDNVARKGIPGAIPVNLFGRNPAISTGTAEDIWDTGGDFVEAATAEVVNITSADTADDLGDTGAEIVRVSGINATFDLASELVTMNGVGDVPTIGEYWFIHEMEVIQAGAGGVNAGAITAITTASGTPTLATMLLGLNKTFMGILMIPDTYFLRIRNWNSSISLAAGGFGEYELQIKPTGAVFQPVEIAGVATGDGSKLIPFEPLIQAPPRSIVKIRAINVSAVAMICSSSFHGALEKVKTGFTAPSI